MLSPSFKRQTQRHRDWRAAVLRSMAAASFASRGAGKQQGKPRCQLVESLAEGMLLHGQHAPPCLLALWVLAGWFPAISQSSKAFIVWVLCFFFSQPSKSAVASKRFSSRIFHFPPALHRVGVKEQGGGCRTGCECCSTPAVRAILFSLQL